mgnify:CR=1 FL=1
MMNKNAYIKAVDNITAPEALVKKIEALDKPVNKKRPIYKTITAFAASAILSILPTFYSRSTKRFIISITLTSSK